MIKNLMNRMVVALLLLGATFGATAQIDLEVNLSINNPTYDVFEFRTVLVQVNNTGTSTATDVEVDIEFPFNNYFTTFFTIMEPSQGEFWKTKGVWNIGDIPAGGAAFVNITFQMLSEGDDLGIFTQVIAANEMDLDSTPNNNTTLVPNEDDENYLNINPVEDTTGDTMGENADTSLPTVEITTETELVTGVFNIQVNFSTPVSGFEANDLVIENAEVLAVYGGDQYFTMTIQPIPGDVVILVVPANAATDSGGNGNTVSEPLFVEYDYVEIPIDLELDLSVTESTISQWENTTFRLTISNTGTNPATDIRVDFGYDAPNNPPLAFVSQNLSMTEYDSWNGLWGIPYLGVGESRVLELTLFALEETNVDLFAQIMDANEVDIDSYYGNDTNQIADEDDEALVSLTVSNFPGLTISNLHSNNTIRVVDMEVQAYPNPTIDYLQLNWTSSQDMEGEILVYDELGQLLFQNKHLIINGFNQSTIDLTNTKTGICTIVILDSVQDIISTQRIVKN